MERHDFAKQDALNLEHTLRPEPGDYWHEMFSPQFLVVSADGAFVEFLDAKTHVMPFQDGYAWNVEEAPTRMTLEQFAERVRYGPSMGTKTWCDVVPNAKGHAWAVAASLETPRPAALEPAEPTAQVPQEVALGLPPLPEPAAHRVMWTGDGYGHWWQYHDAETDPMPEHWDDEDPDIVEQLYSAAQMTDYARAALALQPR